MLDAGAAVAGDAGAGGHVEDADEADRQRGGERVPVHVGHRDAVVIGRTVSSANALRARHGIDRRFVHWIDSDRDKVGIGGGPWSLVATVIGSAPFKTEFPV